MDYYKEEFDKHILYLDTLNNETANEIRYILSDLYYQFVHRETCLVCFHSTDGNICNHFPHCKECCDDCGGRSEDYTD